MRDEPGGMWTTEETELDRLAGFLGCCRARESGVSGTATAEKFFGFRILIRWCLLVKTLDVVSLIPCKQIVVRWR